MSRSNAVPFQHCAYCEEPFDPGVSYPAIAHEPVGSELTLLSFCDARCEAAWQSERD